MPHMSLRIRIKNTRNVIGSLRQKVDGIQRMILEALGVATTVLSKARLEGKFGQQYSHQYYHEELGRMVDRYLIRHDQTGHLKNSHNWSMIGSDAVRIYNSAEYADSVAWVDEVDFGGMNDPYLKWAGYRAVNNLLKTRNLQKYQSAHELARALVR